MNKAELSKVKHIFKVYLGGDGLLHCEKYPVIYSNKVFTYTKEYNNPRLCMISTSSICENMYEYVANQNPIYVYSVRHLGYVYNVENTSPEYLAEVLSKINNLYTASKLDQLKHRVEFCKKRYEDAVASLEEFERENTNE